MKLEKELTRAEEQVMQILWKLEKAYVKEMIHHFPDTKPAYNTVSTIVSILVKKGYVSFNRYGNTYEYYPLITNDEYKKLYLNNFVNKYFKNSYSGLLSFFAGDKNISIQELEEMKNLMENEIQKKKEND